MLQKQICLNLNQRLTLTKSYNIKVVMHTIIVILLENYSLALNNFV